MSFKVIIPVRYNSKRLPGKPLLDINGKPMIRHVYDKAVMSGANSVIVATDSTEIAKVAKDFGANVCMTSSEHNSGTERIAEVVEAMGFDDDEIIVNLQGDEPLMPSAVIHQVANDLEIHDSSKVATICEPILDINDLFNPNVVKVVMNKRGFAMYFSRAAIPWERDSFATDKKIMQDKHFKHVGIYAYRVSFLQDYLQSDNSDIERCESLEQLRVLWHGNRIHVTISQNNIPNGVDTPEDLSVVRAILSSNNSSLE